MFKGKYCKTNLFDYFYTSLFTGEDHNHTPTAKSPPTRIFSGKGQMNLHSDTSWLSLDLLVQVANWELSLELWLAAPVVASLTLLFLAFFAQESLSPPDDNPPPKKPEPKTPSEAGDDPDLPTGSQTDPE